MESVSNRPPSLLKLSQFEIGRRRIDGFGLLRHPVANPGHLRGSDSKQETRLLVQPVFRPANGAAAGYRRPWRNHQRHQSLLRQRKSVN